MASTAMDSIAEVHQLIHTKEKIMSVSFTGIVPFGMHVYSVG